MLAVWVCLVQLSFLDLNHSADQPINHMDEKWLREGGLGEACSKSELDMFGWKQSVNKGLAFDDGDSVDPS